MAEGLGFQFSIEFDPFGIPRGFKDRFEAALREEAVLGKGLKCYLGALGGNRFTYGFVWRPGGDLTLEDRQRFEEWLRAQPVTCKVALGDPERMEASDINRELTERVFELDNLSAADRQAAAEWKAWVFARLPNKPREQAEPGAAADGGGM
jgi:hypothetical protein